MKARSLAAMIMAAFVAACGEPTVIDVVKDSSVAECSSATVGDMLVGYFPTTNWTAYNGEAPGTFEVRGSGELQYVGVTQTAELRFSYDESDGRVVYLGASLNGTEQPAAMAGEILQTMCEEARN